MKNLNNFKPMLAATVEDPEELFKRFGTLYASPKLDGIRAITLNNSVCSRNLKAIPNEYVQKTFGHLPDGFDGELIVGKFNSSTCFRDTSSGCMSVAGVPDVTFYIFDVYMPHNQMFETRYKFLKEFMSRYRNKNVKLLPQVKLRNAFDLHVYEEDMLERGFEGVMLRTTDGSYKFGRSTLKEGYLMKLKRFMDSEAIIIGVKELNHNQNEKTTDELGRAKRSTHKENMVAGNVLGAVTVRDVHTKIEFDIGSGFVLNERTDLWAMRDSLIGKIVKYKYFPTGSKTKPRFPVFLGFRHSDDFLKT